MRGDPVVQQSRAAQLGDGGVARTFLAEKEGNRIVNVEPFPATLKELDNPELIAFLEGMEGWDRTPNRLEDSHAEDWGELKDRMNFIVDLFRTRHLSPEISARPFTDAQEADLRAGRLPTGPF